MNNRRDMPWRDDPTPYHVLVSEIMLQQTQVDTVRPYYTRFIAEFPDFETLSKASDDRLMKFWEGLGYYTRARSLKKTADTVTLKYGGRLPEDYEALLKLPGIGAYTAGAVLSIAFHKPYPVVDGNVLRVVSRLEADASDIGEERTKKLMADRLSEVLCKSRVEPSYFNQGLMELGALICKKNGRPLCEDCPLNMYCKAFLTDTVSNYPVKSVKLKKKTEDKTVFLIRMKEKFCIVKRPEGGLLSGLYAFPEVSGKLNEKAATESVTEMGFVPENLRRLPEAQHIFTHVIWHMRAYLVDIKDTITSDDANMIFASVRDIEDNYALPSAFKKWDVIRTEKI